MQNDLQLPQMLSRPAPHRPVAERVRDWIVWFGAARLIVTVCSIMAVGAGGFWLLRTPPAPVESELPMARSSESSAPATTVAALVEPAPPVSNLHPETVPVVTAAAGIVVHIAGSVAAPGVYRLPAGSRVIDAVEAAGGSLADANGDAINQAEVLGDGERIYVPSIDDASSIVPGVSGGGVGGTGGGSTGESGTAQTAPIDLNRASADELDALPGVGPATAAAIVEHRDRNGPFLSVDDLADVRGIGPAKLEAIRGLVTT